MNRQVIYFCELIKKIFHPDDEFCLEDNVDWEFLVLLAKKHNLLPIFMEEAIKNISYISRPAYKEEMHEALVIVAAQVKRTSSFLKLYEAFLEAGIHPIVMKGLICREMYDTLAEHRPSGDEDILIRPSEYWKAKEVLVANGYVPQIKLETESQLQRLQEISFIHSVEKLHIELHLNPMGTRDKLRSSMSDCFRDVFEDYRETEINGIKIRTMSHQKHLLFLILHAFKHFTGGGFGIRQIIDILLYQEKYGTEIDMIQLQNVLHDFQADVFWSDIIHIGNKYLGFDIPTPFLPNCPQELLEDMVWNGVFGNDTKAQVTAGRTVMLATGNNSKNKHSNSSMIFLKSIFPNKSYLLYHAPYLEKRPWLLPIEWVRRWGRFARKSRGKDRNLAFESMKISQRRLKLLKQYDLV